MISHFSHSSSFMDVCDAASCVMQIRSIARVYFSVNGWRVVAYVIVHLVGSVQRVLIEYVGTRLVCDSEFCH